MSSPPPQSGPTPMLVGNSFVKQYYTLLNTEPKSLHRFYNGASIATHGGPVQLAEEQPVCGQVAINKMLMEHGFDNCQAELFFVDCQPGLQGGVVMLVHGVLTNNNARPRRFTQTFFLAVQRDGYYVHNDIFRFLDAGEDKPESRAVPPEQLVVPEQAAPPLGAQAPAPTPSQPGANGAKPVPSGPASATPAPAAATPAPVPAPVPSPSPAAGAGAVAAGGGGGDAAAPAVPVKSPEPAKTVVEPAPVMPAAPVVPVAAVATPGGAASPQAVEPSPAPVAPEPDHVAPLPQANAEAPPPSTWAARVVRTKASAPGAAGAAAPRAANAPRPSAPVASGAAPPATPNSEASPAAPAASAASAPAAQRENGTGEDAKARAARPKGDANQEEVVPGAVFVGNLPHSAEAETLTKLFEQFGAVQSVQLKADKAYAFVYFEDDEPVAAAVQAKGTVYLGNALNITRKNRNNAARGRGKGRFDDRRGRGRGRRGGGRGPRADNSRS